MVARKERTLLIEVHSLDAAAAPPPSAALHEELREAAQRSGALADGAVLQARHYSREARLCAVRTTLGASRAVSTAIKSIRFVKHSPVRLAVVRAYGNERLARRAFAARLEAALQADGVELSTRRALREQLEKLGELQKA